MSEIKVVVDDAKRTKYIAVGLAIVILLTYAWMAGWLSLVTSLIVRRPEDTKLHSAWSVGTEIAGDALYFIGVAGVAIFSGISSAVMAVIGWVTRKTGGTADAVDVVDAVDTVSKEQLDSRTKLIYSTVQKPINELISEVAALTARVDAIESPSPAVRASRPKKPTTKKVSS